MALAYSLLVGICAVMVAVVFVMSWRNQDVPLVALLGVVFLSLVVVAMVALRVAL